MYKEVEQIRDEHGNVIGHIKRVYSAGGVLLYEKTYFRKRRAKKRSAVVTRGKTRLIFKGRKTLEERIDEIVKRLQLKWEEDGK